MFPGSNCDHDAWYAVPTTSANRPNSSGTIPPSLGDVDAVILPGGFSYGDYLRCGAIARFSPVMGAVSKFAADGGLVLGICNGFQILVESGLLPGALLRNRGSEIRLPRSHAAHGNHRFARSPATREKGQIAACRWPTAKAATSRTSARSIELEAEDRVVLPLRR